MKALASVIIAGSMLIVAQSADARFATLRAVKVDPETVFVIPEHRKILGLDDTPLSKEQYDAAVSAVNDILAFGGGASESENLKSLKFYSSRGDDFLPANIADMIGGFSDCQITIPKFIGAKGTHTYAMVKAVCFPTARDGANRYIAISFDASKIDSISINFNPLTPVNVTEDQVKHPELIK